MRKLTFVVRATSVVVAVGIAGGLLGGCYGTVRTRFPDDDGGGTGGGGGSTGGSSGGASVDGGPIGCSVTCRGPTTGPATGSGACINDECGISCNGAFPTLCAASNACVDLMSDGKNCGACGHDCLGGTCASGECQPTLIAQYFGHPEIIYVGAQAVYATTDLGYVGRANKDGSDLKPVAMPGFASSSFSGTVLAEDGDRVFLVRVPAGPIQLSYCETSGCDSTAMALGGPYTQYFAVDQAGHKIIWVDYSPLRLMSATTQGVVSGAALPGGALGDGGDVMRLFHTHGGVYFGVGNDIRRIPVAGGAIASVAYGNSPLVILGANNTSLFVSDGNAISSVPLPSGDGGAPHAVIGTGVNTNVHGHFAADDRRMYWTDDDREGNACEISNCAGTRKALPKRGVDRFEDIGADDAAIYLLADSSDGASGALSTVWRLAK